MKIHIKNLDEVIQKLSTTPKKLPKLELTPEQKDFLLCMGKIIKLHNYERAIDKQIWHFLIKGRTE